MRRTRWREGRGGGGESDFANGGIDEVDQDSFGAHCEEEGEVRGEVIAGVGGGGRGGGSLALGAGIAAAERRRAVRTVWWEGADESELFGSCWSLFSGRSECQRFRLAIAEMTEESSSRKTPSLKSISSVLLPYSHKDTPSSG